MLQAFTSPAIPMTNMHLHRVSSYLTKKMKVRWTGILLGVSPTKIEQAFFENPHNICLAAYTVLLEWFQTMPDGPDKWIELYAALNEGIGEANTYDLYREFKSSALQSSQTMATGRKFGNFSLSLIYYCARNFSPKIPDCS